MEILYYEMRYTVAKRTMSIGNCIDINRFGWRYLDILFDEKSILINFVRICNLHSLSGSKHTSHLDLTIGTKNYFSLFIYLSFVPLYTLIIHFF